MLTKRTNRKLQAAAKRVALVALMLGGAGSASAQVVDLPTTAIDHLGNPVPATAVQQVQAQTPAPTPVPLQPPAATPQPPGAVAQPPAATPQPPAATPQPPGATPQPPGLNVDPNADIGDIPVPQQQAPPSLAQPGPTAGGAIGATAGAFSSAPTIIGDFQGGGLAQIMGRVIVPTQFYAPGIYVAGSPGDQAATVAYEIGGDLVPNDVFTTGLGIDAAGADGQFDTFQILEPVPPSDAPTSPGPGFTFDGGNAVFTRVGGAGAPTTAQPGIILNGDQWFISYSYSQEIGGPGGGGGAVPPTPVPSPGVSVRRVKIAENFSPDVRDRCFVNYSFFNDAFGGLGDIARFVPGFEKVLVDSLISVEVRVPMAGTYGSTQTLGARIDRSYEIGNPSIIGKGILLRNDRFVWAGGVGVALPLADDTILRAAGFEVVRIENESVFVQPFTGVLYRPTQRTSLQGYMQVDITANGDPIYANLIPGGPLPLVGKFNDSTLLHIDVAATHSVYRNPCARWLTQALINGELHYTGTVQESDVVTAPNFTYQNLKRNFNIVNATAGMHLVLGQNVVVTPAMTVPLRSGLDEAFDYEATVQLNYLH